MFYAFAFIHVFDMNALARSIPGPSGYTSPTFPITLTLYVPQSYKLKIPGSSRYVMTSPPMKKPITAMSEGN